LNADGRTDDDKFGVLTADLGTFVENSMTITPQIVAQTSDNNPEKSGNPEIPDRVNIIHLVYFANKAK